jgi:hypothetical protein
VLGDHTISVISLFTLACVDLRKPLGVVNLIPVIILGGLVFNLIIR